MGDGNEGPDIELPILKPSEADKKVEISHGRIATFRDSFVEKVNC